MNKPDAWMNPDSGLRLRLQAWEPLCRIGDQFIERPRSLRMIWSYLRHVGVVAVVRKVISRRAESVRNKKVVALGAGVVLGAGRTAGFKPGDRVVCLALNHPETPMRNIISIDRGCVRTVAWLNRSGEDFSGKQNTDEMLAAVAPWKGWSPFSGVRLDEQGIEAAMRVVSPRFATLIEGVVSPNVEDNKDIGGIERIEAPVDRKPGKTAVIFGLGNYAKTQIVPTVRKELDLACVHEIDPDQFATNLGNRVTLDSSPLPRDEEQYDAWFISGYHHTHASLAIEALRRGACAVVEKPLATTKEQLDGLLDWVNSSETPRLFACFQKRYSRLHEWACEDLGCGSGEAVNMYASVFEIPLPHAHWYNWSVSGSRLVSNGCHWLDYFMYINDYAKVAEADVTPMQGSDLLVTVCLENDARLVLSLTDTGSARLGVRELVELRRGDATVRITDAKRYESENTARKLRNRVEKPVRAYDRMYTAICRKILSGEPGDPVASMRSTALMLRLEQQLVGLNSMKQAESGRRTAYRSSLS